MKNQRWVLLGLCMFITIGLYVLTMTFDDHQLPFWLYPMQVLFENIFWPILYLSVTIISHILFIYGTGIKNLNDPIGKSRLLIITIIAGFMMAFLVMGLCFTGMESLPIQNPNWVHVGILLSIIGLSWIGWSFYLFFHNKNAESFLVAKHVLFTLFIGSIVVLLLSITSYIMVRYPNPEFLEGLFSAIGIIHSILVMLWTMGMAIILFLFLQKRQLNSD